MRVAIVTPEFLPNWGGIGTYTAQLAMNLPSDFEVHVISLRRGGAAGKEDGSREILDRISLH
ncbi:MAG: glycosyltransferase family 4 protein, partial [Euryarchaeota archaeon]|nr:glycosyltransferase family 4 protein [Euryarchaeota archaeon]